MQRAVAVVHPGPVPLGVLWNEQQRILWENLNEQNHLVWRAILVAHGYQEDWRRRHKLERSARSVLEDDKEPGLG